MNNLIDSFSEVVGPRKKRFCSTKSLVLSIGFFAWVFFSSNAFSPVIAQQNNRNGLIYPDIDVPLLQGDCVSGVCYTASSPVTADVNGDGKLDVIAASTDGRITVVQHDGAVLWSKDVAPMFGMAAGTQEIWSSPAVADIDADGQVEIVFAAGATRDNICTKGGVGVLDHLGRVQTNWPQLTTPNVNHSSGGDCNFSIFSTPALGDLDNDGDLEIIVGGFDKRIYGWEHTGELLPNFPPDSYLSNHYPTWGDLRGKLADSIWSSPSLADINDDGYLDIIIGTDEGFFEDLNQYTDMNWDCYRTPTGWAEGYCGGALYVIDRHGDSLPGFPIYLREAITSSPTVADLDEDGYPEILIGAGDFYHRESPDKPTDGFRLHVFDHQGNRKAGWDTATAGDGGIVLSDSANSSPIVGDITGSNRLEVIITDKEGRLYAFDYLGRPIQGFPFLPKNHQDADGHFDHGNQPILADTDNDGKMEILLTIGSSTAIVDGDGRMITSQFWPGNTKPIYFKDELVINTPAVSDLDNDGDLELIVAGKTLGIWDLADTGTEVDWGAWRHSAERTGSIYRAGLTIGTDANSARFVGSPDDQDIRITLTFFSIQATSMAWSSNVPAEITVSEGEGWLAGNEVTVELILEPSTLGTGEFDLGDASFTIEASTADRTASIIEQFEIPVTAQIQQMHHIFLPSLNR